jgi:hypothetical protein
MPVYTIQLEDGRKVRVQATNPNDALAEANDYARSNPRQAAGRKYLPPKRQESTRSAIDTLITQGVSFGQMPKVQGAVGSLIGIPDAVRQGSLKPIAEAYRQNEQDAIRQVDEARARLGLAGGVLEGVASLGTGGALANAAKSAATRFAPQATAAATRALTPRAGNAVGQAARATGRTVATGAAGAAAGAAYGSGEGRAVENALYGAVGGAAARPIAAAAGGLGRAAARVAGRPVQRPEQTAARKLVGKLRPTAAQEIAEAQRLGLDPLSVVDVSRNSGRRIVRGSAAANDAGQEITTAYRATTREALPDRAQNIVRRMTGNEVDFPAAQQAAKANVRKVDEANYPQLMNQKVNITPELLDTLTSQRARGALGTAMDIADTAGRRGDVTALARFNEALQTGNIDDALNTPITASALEDVYRALRDTSRGMVQSTGEQAATRSVGRALGDVTQSYDATLQAISPDIAQARAASREARQGAEALDVGFNAFGPARLPAAVSADVAALPQSARPNVLAGGQARLQQQIGENPFAAVNAMAYRPNMTERLNAMGAPTDDMVRSARIEAERARTADFISPNTGSQTQLRATDLEDMGGIPVTPYGIGQKLMDFAFRRANALTGPEMEALVRMGVEPADIAALQQLAARNPERIPSVIKGLIGTQAGMQLNASGRPQANQQTPTY